MPAADGGTARHGAAHTALALASRCALFFIVCRLASSGGSSVRKGCKGSLVKHHARLCHPLRLPLTSFFGVTL